jgi:hypothetical protein
MAYFQHIGDAPIIIQVSRSIAVRFERAGTPGSIKNLSVEAATHPDIAKLVSSGRLLPLPDDDGKRRLESFGAAATVTRGLTPRNKGSHRPGQQGLRPRASARASQTSQLRGNDRQPRNVFEPVVQRGFVTPPPPTAPQANLPKELLAPVAVPEAVPVISPVDVPEVADVFEGIEAVEAVEVVDAFEVSEVSEPEDVSEVPEASEEQEPKVGKTTRGRKRQIQS